jgi:hypothetical protein
VHFRIKQGGVNAFGEQETTVTSPETILKWLKEAGAYAFHREDPEGSLVIDLLVEAQQSGCALRAVIVKSSSL